MNLFAIHEDGQWHLWAATDGDDPRECPNSLIIGQGASIAEAVSDAVRQLTEVTAWGSHSARRWRTVLSACNQI